MNINEIYFGVQTPQGNTKEIEVKLPQWQG